ncbi:MAG: hypothetical protein K6E31_00880 [bacterium]|nr:hypothetical protein [bacterium]
MAGYFSQGKNSDGCFMWNMKKIPTQFSGEILGTVFFFFWQFVFRAAIFFARTKTMTVPRGTSGSKKAVSNVPLKSLLETANK